MLFVPVSLNAQTTSFTYQAENNVYCAPVEVNFIQSSSGSPVGYLWDFGDGGYSNSANPSYIYSSAGTYTVRLIAVYDNSTAQMSRSITINPSINTNFTLDRNNICQPGIINFNASAAGAITNYQWDFGDSSAIINTTTRNISHNYTGYGEFTITLTCTNASGCTASSSRTLMVREPVISGSIDLKKGCIPVNALLRANVNVPNGSTVNRYLWNFGDGNSTTTSVNQVSHNYSSVGSFLPTLTITTIDGCTASYNYDSVAYGIPPTNHIAYPVDTVVCGSETPQFVSKATNATSYAWDFGGTTPVITHDTIIGHRFSQLGVKDITVTPYFNGCAGSPISFQINIIGVIAKYTYKNTCNDKKTFSIKNTSQGNISTILWNLGDGNTSTVMGNFVHTYPPTGEFPLRLDITDNITGCVDSLTRKIYTADPSLINPDRSICINTNTNYSIANNYTNPAAVYTWNVVGMQMGSGSEPSLTINANILGHFDTNFVVINNGAPYCPDTAALDHPLTVRGPQLDFDAPLSICLHTPYEVLNLSRPFQPADTVRLWYWNFGKVSTNDTVFQPQPYIYSNAKIYDVQLTAIDMYGCKDSLLKKVFVRPMPFIWIIPKLDTVCSGQSSTLIGYTSDQILWTPVPVNSNFCNTCDTTSVRPTVSTKYYATATNSYNCVSTDSAFVKVFTPFTAVPLTPDSAFCKGGKVQLDMEPKMKKITWSPAESLSGSTIYNPVASPVRTTTYTATLTDSAGCFSSSADIRVTVKANPAVNAGPDKVYPYHTNFSFTPSYSSNVVSYLWSPADSLSCSNCAVPTGLAMDSKTYTVTVVSDSGCISRDQVTIAVNAKILMPSAFTPNNDQLNDRYRPIARGIKSIKSFSIYNREGLIIYQARDFYPGETSFGWDGKYRGQDQSAAAYIYIVEAVSDLGHPMLSKGSFILIR